MEESAETKSKSADEILDELFSQLETPAAPNTNANATVAENIQRETADNAAASLVTGKSDEAHDELKGSKEKKDGVSKKHKKEKKAKKEKKKKKEKGKEKERKDKKPTEEERKKKSVEEVKETENETKRVKAHDKRREERSRRSNSRHRPSSRDDKAKGRRDDRERRDIEKHTSRSKTRHRTRSRSPLPRKRSRSRSPQINKAHLLEVARQNLKKLQEKGVNVGADSESLRIVKAGGKTVEELTDFCKNLAGKEDMLEAGEIASDEETSLGAEKTFTRHPFQVKPRSDPIVMNIRNAIQLPVRKPEERLVEKTQLKQQFPVSSGQHHRGNELEWVPVSPKREPPAPPPKKKKEKESPGKKTEKTPVTAVVAPLVNDSAANIDISSVVAQRLSAIRRLQENPNDFQAQLELQEAEFRTKNWADAHHTNPLTGEKMQNFVDFSEAPPAWTRKNQFKEATPVAGGVGMRLLQKMGWQPGEGLGRNKEGTLEPLSLDIKMDKKGLVSKEELAPKTASFKLMQEFQGKHPVSLIHELCTKNKWGPPVFEQIADIGPDHQKHFLYMVIVNNVEYRPCVASTTKKDAKALAAAVCLQSLGMIPA